MKVLFDPGSEYAALLPLQPTLQRVVEALNSSEIPPETYAQDELLGWVYQYYNAREKQAVYDRLGRGQKIEKPEELAAATCLYTERYMVDYLLQNTIGALWVEMHPESNLPATWPYYVRPPSPDAGSPSPRAERGPGGEVRPHRLRDVTLMDPACGSGHFLVRAFDLLVEMYREEGLEPETEIPHLILERNLHGIDIDLRAVQIAALALYVKARALDGPGFQLRRLNLVPAGAILPGEDPPAGYMARFGGDPELEAVVKGIWRGLRNVREFGSLLHPERAIDEVAKRRREEDARRYPMLQRGDAEWARWKADLLAGLREEFERQAQTEDLGQKLFGKEAAKGVSLVEALGQQYDVVITNPPYAGSKNLDDDLKRFVEREYKAGKRDLYAAFILRCRDFAKHGGYVGMVTQQSWMFLRSFAGLRKDMLERTGITTLAHLGEHAFEESAAAGAFVALFTLQVAPLRPYHRLVAFRLVGPKSPAEKQSLLCRVIVGEAPNVISSAQQAAFRAIPEMPITYWLRQRFLDLLGSSARLQNQMVTSEGLGTRDDERFVRYFWESHEAGQKWFPFVKGGGYRRWWGLNHWIVDYGQEGAAIKAHIVQRFPYLKGNYSWLVRNPELYGKAGLTFTDIARGSLGVRLMPRRAIFTDKGPALFPRSIGVELLAAYLNSLLATYLLRALSPTLQFRTGYIRLLPACPRELDDVAPLVAAALTCQQQLTSHDPLERSFAECALEGGCGHQSLLHRLPGKGDSTASLLHTVEGVVERRVVSVFHIEEGDVERMWEETGAPAGWQPLLAGYDQLVDGPPGAQALTRLREHLAAHRRLSLPAHSLSRLKGRLSILYQAGPGAKTPATDDEAPEPVSDESGSEDDEADVALGARILVPPQTFIEELSRKIEVHPISVYWLLEEMREKEGLVSPPELKRHLEDYVSVTVLRLLGYRWPKQDAYEKEHGPILDPALVDDDGVIPLVPCGDQPTAEQLVDARLERDFGEEGAAQSEREFRQWVGRDIGEWLRRDFFRQHVQQFKRRPIAWHLASPERTFEAFVLYHKLSRAILQKLRAQYAGNFIARLRAEQERARQRKEEAHVRELQLQIEDVEEFRARIEAIERGDELKYRMRCRWKGEEATGRPGPYAPDIDDGVKVNIRPFQEAGLLAVREVIRKW